MKLLFIQSILINIKKKKQTLVQIIAVGGKVRRLLNFKIARQLLRILQVELDPLDVCRTIFHLDLRLRELISPLTRWLFY